MRECAGVILAWRRSSVCSRIRIVVLLIALVFMSTPVAMAWGNEAETSASGDQGREESAERSENENWISKNIVLPAVSSGPEMLSTVYIHAFGEEAFGITNNDNEYLAGDTDGKWDNLAGGIVLGARPLENLRIHSQILFDMDGVALDYLFAEVTFADWINVRGGQFSQPFGLYSEILEVGTLRPLYTLAPSVYGFAGLTAISVTGATFGGSVELGGSWTMKYDAYYGIGRMLEGRDSVQDNRVPKDVDRLVGGRIQFETPIEGLMVGAAGYYGEHEGYEVCPPFPGCMYVTANPQFHWVAGAQAQYLNGPWTARAEYYYQKEDIDSDTHVVYAEGAYHILPWLQVAARYDFYTSEVHTANIPENALRHDELTFGVNFWMGSNLALKLNYAHIWGNRFANPEDTDFANANDQTDYGSIGVQFSF